MLEQIVFALNLLGPKAIAAYIVVIIAIVAISLYTRRGAATR